MKKYPFSVYVACSLTHAPQEFKDAVELLKKDLRGICNVLCFLGVGTGATPRQIWEWDINHCVQTCNLLVAITDRPSTGMGIEMGKAEGWGKPILAVGHTDSLVTDLILDPPAPGFTFRRYQDLRPDVFGFVEEKLAEMLLQIGPTLFDLPIGTAAA